MRIFLVNKRSEGLCDCFLLPPPPFPLTLRTVHNPISSLLLFVPSIVLLTILHCFSLVFIARMGRKCKNSAHHERAGNTSHASLPPRLPPANALSMTFARGEQFNNVIEDFPVSRLI